MRIKIPVLVKIKEVWKYLWIKSVKACILIHIHSKYCTKDSLVQNTPKIRWATLYGNKIYLISLYQTLPIFPVNTSLKVVHSSIFNNYAEWK